MDYMIVGDAMKHFSERLDSWEHQFIEQQMIAENEGWA